MDSNHRPRAYQARALTSWAISPYLKCFSFILFPFVTFVTGGDDGIRTHDPLLAGQVLSQLSYTPIMRYPLTGCWHRPIFPSRFQLSIFGTAQLNFCVRNGNRWTLCVSGTNYYFNSVTENWTTNLLDFDLRPTVIFWMTVTFSIERRWSSRTFRYGYLVTT